MILEILALLAIFFKIKATHFLNVHTNSSYQWGTWSGRARQNGAWASRRHPPPACGRWAGSTCGKAPAKILHKILQYCKNILGKKANGGTGRAGHRARTCQTNLLGIWKCKNLGNFKKNYSWRKRSCLSFHLISLAIFEWEHSKVCWFMIFCYF